MYKSALPSNCPPKEAQEQTIELFRLLSENDIEASFKNHVELYPENEGYKQRCEAYGLSLFDNTVKLEVLKKKDNNSEKVIAKVLIEPEYGTLVKDNPKTGHYTLWLYEQFDPATVKYEIL